MEFKSMEKWRVMKMFNMNEKQYKRLEKRITKRHPLEEWIIEYIAPNGERVTYFKLEFVEWLKEVYFNRKKYYLDAEIDFFEKQVARLENELDFTHIENHYEDISLYILRDVFRKGKNAIGVAVNRMEKRTGKFFRYVKDGKVMVSGEGVKWLSERYFRKNYLKRLEYNKLRLQNIKRVKHGYKELFIIPPELIFNQN